MKTDPIDGRRQRKKRALKERIYQTARQLFLVQGYGATTVEQIAESADVAQATFFNHFPSKDAVLSEMTREVSERLEELVQEQMRRRVPASERLKGFADQGAKELESAHGLARDVLLELMRTSARPGETVPYLAAVREHFTAMIRDGQARKDVRTDVDAVFLAELVVGAFNSAVINWMNDASYPLEQRLRETAAFMGEAIRPRGAPRSTRSTRTAKPKPRKTARRKSSK